MPMPIRDLHSDDDVSRITAENTHSQINQPQSPKVRESDKVVNLINIEERRLLVIGTIFLSILGVITFLYTGQIAVVAAMNTPLLAVIGKDFFAK
jgi:hypothetical protein